eukprot:623818-Prorocentrum_minimum.AAC.1
MIPVALVCGVYTLWYLIVRELATTHLTTRQVAAPRAEVPREMIKVVAADEFTSTLGEFTSALGEFTSGPGEFTSGPGEFTGERGRHGGQRRRSLRGDGAREPTVPGARGAGQGGAGVKRTCHEPKHFLLINVQ